MVTAADCGMWHFAVMGAALSWEIQPHWTALIVHAFDALTQVIRWVVVFVIAGQKNCIEFFNRRFRCDTVVSTPCVPHLGGVRIGMLRWMGCGRMLTGRPRCISTRSSRSWTICKDPFIFPEKNTKKLIDFYPRFWKCKTWLIPSCFHSSQKCIWSWLQRLCGAKPEVHRNAKLHNQPSSALHNHPLHCIWVPFCNFALKLLLRSDYILVPLYPYGYFHQTSTTEDFDVMAQKRVILILAVCKIELKL